MKIDETIEFFRSRKLPWSWYTGPSTQPVDLEPVASSLLLLTCGVAGLFCVATVPEARGMGIGTAISLAPMREALKMGYRVGVVHSSKMGYGVYRRIGFQDYCTIGIYRPSFEKH
jgi:GNAT superfamily N-acetyltransferase